jgi:N-acetylglucosaminyl-diphospho-decaprenol L-rhamnosyltransferase
MQSVAVIIVNYGTAALAIAAVESVLARGHGGRDVTVHLLDNASPGDDAARFTEAKGARGWGDRVRLHLEDENHGFGRGNNLVFGRLQAADTPPDAVFLLNPDATLANEAIDILAETLEARPEVGFAGAALAGPDGQPQEGAFRFPNIPNEFAHSVSFGPLARAMNRWAVHLPLDLGEGDVDWVSGAGVLIRFEALCDLGGFDPDFFLYYEEVELMWRAARRGWKRRYVPQARITHDAGAATEVNNANYLKRMPIYAHESWRYYFVKTHGRLGAAVAVCARLSGAALNVVIARLRRSAGYTPPGFFPDFWRHAAKPILFGHRV